MGPSNSSVPVTGTSRRSFVRDLGLGVLAATAPRWLHAATPIESPLVWHSVNINRGIGQGDMHLLQLPCGGVGAIDIGLSGDSPGATQAAFTTLGIKHLDFLVLTHYHRDHYGCIPEMLRSGITIGRYYHNLPTAEQCAHESPWGCTWQEIQDLLEMVRRSGAQVIDAEPGMIVYSHRQAEVETKLEILCAHDAIHTPFGRTSINDMSVVCSLRHGSIRTLFTGDIGSTLGTYLARSMGFSLAADVLKVPHHGAEDTAPNAFFEQVSPKLYVVPSPKKLWASDRCARVRGLITSTKMPSFVNGLDGSVKVTYRSDSFQAHIGAEPC